MSKRKSYVEPLRVCKSQVKKGNKTGAYCRALLHGDCVTVEGSTVVGKIIKNRRCNSLKQALGELMR